MCLLDKAFNDLLFDELLKVFLSSLLAKLLSCVSRCPDDTVKFLLNLGIVSSSHALVLRDVLLLLLEFRRFLSCGQLALFLLVLHRRLILLNILDVIDELASAKRSQLLDMLAGQELSNQCLDLHHGI